MNFLKNQLKIGEANGMPNLATQVTFGPRVQAIALRGS